MSTKTLPFLLFLLSLAAWTQGLPSWVSFQQGRLALAQGRWSDAIQLLREALSKRSIYPEADWYLGRVYFATGELSSARQHFEAALADADFLRFPEDRYQILYDLDSLLAVQPGRENTLRRINLLRDSILLTKLEERRTLPDELRSLGDRDRQLFLNAFLEPYVGRLEERRYALDRLLFLYRRDPDYTLEALTRLAQLWTEKTADIRSDPRIAASYSLHALLMLFSRSLRDLQQIDPSFQFGVLTPNIYEKQRGTPAEELSEMSLHALFQPAAARSGPGRRLTLYQSPYEYLTKNKAPLLLKLLAQNLRRWGEAADLALQSSSGWEPILARALGTSMPVGEPWRSVLGLGDASLDYNRALGIPRHLFLREKETCRILADLFLETPEGTWALERLREIEGREGTLVRPVLVR